MDERVPVRMRVTELIAEAEWARLARQARRPAGTPARPGGGRARSLMLAAARWWRRPAGAGGAARARRVPGAAARARRVPGGWSPAGDSKVAGRTR
jgi:hypothetical protein